MKQQLLDMPFPAIAQTTRQPGLHVSEIIRSISDDLFSKGKGWPERELNLAAEVGFTWERMAELALRDRLGWRPEEMQLDGVWMSPDYIYLDDVIHLRELKATWKSIKNSAPSDVIKWMMQTKAYCKNVGTHFCNFYVLNINGDYRPPMPQFNAYAIEFTQRELDENWQMLLNHVRHKGML